MRSTQVLIIGRYICSSSIRGRNQTTRLLKSFFLFYLNLVHTILLFGIVPSYRNFVVDQDEYFATDAYLPISKRLEFC